jgi:ketosteroid isomerase-like protein
MKNENSISSNNEARQILFHGGLMTLLKKHFILQVIILTFLSVIDNSLYAQKSSEKFKSEITKAVEIWNAACKKADINQVMSLLDDSEEIMVIGSANGEINKGKEEVKKWVSQLFGFAGFSWEMNRIDITGNGKTAWVFVDGKMVVNFHKGGKKVTPYRFTEIWVKKKGAWKLSLFDGSVPQSE